MRFLVFASPDVSIDELLKPVRVLGSALSSEFSGVLGCCLVFPCCPLELLESRGVLQVAAELRLGSRATGEPQAFRLAAGCYPP